MGQQQRGEQILLTLFLIFLFSVDLCSGHELCTFPARHDYHEHGYHRHHHHDHYGCDHGHVYHDQHKAETKLPEELAEEEDMRLCGFDNYQSHHHHHDNDFKLSGLGLWLNALGCSLLAEAMLGDAFLHQLPHAFGAEHFHFHGRDADHSHSHSHFHENSHSHSLKDLSVGLSILGRRFWYSCKSGFSASEALFFNFFSALVAPAGTDMALLWQDPRQSSLIEGFTAGGFVYIAVAGVLAEMNSASSTMRSSAVQMVWLVLGHVRCTMHLSCRMRSHCGTVSFQCYRMSELLFSLVPVVPYHEGVF